MRCHFPTQRAKTGAVIYWNHIKIRTNCQPGPPAPERNVTRTVAVSKADSRVSTVCPPQRQGIGRGVSWMVSRRAEATGAEKRSEAVGWSPVGL